MELKDYFEVSKGKGVLATASSDGKVDAAIYASPCFVDGENCAFIMSDKLTHKNISENPKAVYLFVENGDKYAGKRLYLKKTKESDDPEEIETFFKEVWHAKAPASAGGNDKKYLVHFNVESVLPLIGDK